MQQSGSSGSFLRVEGVNLDSFVYDTGDLSTTRGGSLLLLHGVDQIAQKFQDELEVVSTGASVGLFAVQDGYDASSVRNDVEDHLRLHSKLGHATWVVDIAQLQGKDFIAAREQLVAKNRWRQMQQPSLVVPKWNHDPGTLQPCTVERRRPATADDSTRGVAVSPSVLVRREFGRAEKQHFFRRLAPQSARSMRFVNDFDALTADPDRGNLHHKMAVLFIDGNDFGRTQDAVIRRGTDQLRSQRLWDLKLKRFHQAFLRSLLQEMKSDPDGWTTTGGEYRIEVLLWGGDDILLVVPAWHGWWTLGFFFQQAAAWTIDGHNLTHKAGLIFCHHKAPIQRISRLADVLAHCAKLDGIKNRAAYHVFESFDNAGGKLETVRQALVPAGTSTDGLVLDGASMLRAQQTFASVKPLIPRRRLTMLVQALRTGTKDRADALRAELETILDSQAGVRSELEACFGSSPSGLLWIHLIELWDYLA